MDLIRLSIERPIAVVAAVIMVLMFGFVALQTIPIQLTPDVNKPNLSITTNWFGAAPAEVEREILNRQEDVLRGLDSLEKMEGSAANGQAKISLEFAIGTNMDRALLLVANRLDRVNGYPDEADEPTLSTSGANDRPIAWFTIRRLPGNDTPINEFGDFMEDVVKDRIERVNGIAEVNIYGGSEREMQVVVAPERMARYGLTVSDLVNALRQANAAVSGGDVDEGKRSYTVRTDGDLDGPDAVRDVVLRTDEDPGSGRVARVTVGDIADVSFGYKDPTANIRFIGSSAIAFNAVREPGANVIATMEGIKEAIAELNRDYLPQNGLRVDQVYDETVYIDASIDLVTTNIWFGGLLAAMILMIFLRSPRATLVVSLAIPISVIGSFVAMAAMGRSLNVISLAGIAFAVGMVVDAAIVVLENIYRLREEGKSPAEAAYKGAAQVWGAILVSAMTTVCVFIPILVMELEVGQLFRDIAVAISVSVVLSLVVSVTMLPALANKLLGRPVASKDQKLGLPGIDHFGRGFTAVVTSLTRLVLKSRLLAIVVAVAVSAVCIFATATLMPKLEYLPTGNRNLMFGILLPPPGYNLETMTEIARRVEDGIRPHLSDRFTMDANGNVLGDDVVVPEPKPGDPPFLSRFFFVARSGATFLGAAAEDPTKVHLLQPFIQKLADAEPGTFSRVFQLSLFSRGLGAGRAIELDISGPDLEVLSGVALQAFGMVNGALPRSEGNQHRPLPDLTLGAPEVRVVPDRRALADAGLSARDLGDAIDAFNDGLRVAEVTVDGERIDLMLKGLTEKISQTQGIGYLPVVTRNGVILPASALSTVELTSGPTEIRHIERVRTITIQITPSDRMPLEEAMEIVTAEVVDPLMAQGLPAGVQVRISGTADQLTQTWNHMVWDLILASVIVYLVMAVLFESFIYPLIIMFSVPLATAGGFVGLAALNLHVDQKLDMLTLLGFVILIGIVVNNAILLVHQSLFLIREEDYEGRAAIQEATRNRIRPIFMSTLTSVFGMLPLVVMPGAGSELYRGLGSVVVGGLSMSAVLTLLIIPPLLSLVLAVTGEDRERGPDGAALTPEGTTADGRPANDPRPQAAE